MPGIIKPNSATGDTPPETIPPFPVESLPPVLEDITRAIVETTGSPLDIVAPCVLATASACLGRGLLVDSAPGRVTPPNLFILVVKNSGAGGSVAYELATAPLRGFQALALREFDEVTKPRLERRRDTVKADYDGAMRQRKKLKESGEDTSAKEKELDGLQVELAGIEASLCAPYVLVSDATPESLAHLLARRGEVLAHFDSDANDTVGGLLGLRYSTGEHTTESLHLKAYSGESFAIIRRGTPRGGTVELFLKRPTLTCLFIVTPDVSRKLFSSDRMKSGGLLPRFILSHSQATPQEWSDTRRIPSNVSQRFEAGCFALLNNFRGRDADADGVAPLEMTAEARELFAAHFKRFCDGFDAAPEFAAFDARHTENAIRIALVIHAWRALRFEPDGNGGPVAMCNALESPLNGDSARRALLVADWFERQQAAMLAPMREAAADEKFERVFQRCEKRRDWIVAARDLVGARIAASATEADELLTNWEREGRATREEPEAKSGAGAPARKPRYRILQSKQRGN